MPKVTEHKVVCYCGALMRLKPSRFGKFYGCTNYPNCKGTHGAHGDGRPLGKPADTETKQARMKAHALFDRLWKSGLMSRGRAYLVLREMMQLNRDEAHIGMFTKEQCELLVVRLLEMCPELRRLECP